VFPDPQDAPAKLAEGAGDEAVAGPVGGDLLSPEGGILPGLAEMPRAPVPETACSFGKRMGRLGSPAPGMWCREIDRCGKGTALRNDSASVRTSWFLEAG
jgi:hypothetical protein